jgi:hypothetical protein
VDYDVTGFEVGTSVEDSVAAGLARISIEPDRDTLGPIADDRNPPDGRSGLVREHGLGHVRTRNGLKLENVPLASAESGPVS